MEKCVEIPARAALKLKAKERFAGRRGACIGVMLATWLIPVALIALVVILLVMLRVRDLTRTSLTIFIVPIALFAQSLFAECAYFYLTVYRGERATAGDFFAGARQRIGRKMGGMLWQSLALGLWTLLLTALTAMLPYLLIEIMPLDFFIHVFAYLPFVNALIIYVPLAIKQVSYAMHVFMLRDCPEAEVPACLGLSSRMMKDNKRRLLVLLLSFAGWVLLAIGPVFLARFLMPNSVVMLCLGGLVYVVVASCFVGPYLLMTLAGFYDELKRALIAAEVISEADFGACPAYMPKRRAKEQERDVQAQE